jgi:outer membrane protein TolC
MGQLYPDLSFTGFLYRYATDGDFRSFFGRAIDQPCPAAYRPSR